MSSLSDTNTLRSTFDTDGCQAPLMGGYVAHTTGNGHASYTGLVNARQRTHGPFHITSSVAQRTKKIWRDTPNWENLSTARQEALEQAATKIARILCGNPDEPDHWDDLGTYTGDLGKRG